jgi:hypothetical protein
MSISETTYINDDAQQTTDKPMDMHAIDEVLRTQILDYSKRFKTSWLELGQNLYSVWRDKLFQAWNFDKFEDYCEQEVGLKKSIALKILKSYIFIEEEEPAYLNKDFNEDREPPRVPGYEEINVLRNARNKKELTKDDYHHLRNQVFEKGQQAGDLRKELATIMKERKPVDPEEERDKRKAIALKRIVHNLKVFKKDMDTLQLIPDDLISESEALALKLEEHIE